MGARLVRVAFIGLLTIGEALPSAGLAGQSSSYPTRPRPLPEPEEVALAMSAAPREISSRATIYVLRADGPGKARDGTNGCTCLVARDLHEGSRYPICFDQEGSASLLHQELMELRLRFEGKGEAEVKRAVAAAYASGALRLPARPAIAYMMSPLQVLFSSPDAEGRRVGSWHPHLMISVPNATEAQFGIPPGSSIDVVQLERSGEPMAQLIVKVPQWSDGSSAAPPSMKPATPDPGSGAAPEARETLRRAEQGLGDDVQRIGMAEALLGRMTPDPILLIEGAPILQDRERTALALRAQPGLAGARLTWMPFRVLVSGDERLGVTFGATLLEPREGQAVTGRYLSVWQRADTGNWRLAAYAHNRAWAAPVTVPEVITRYSSLQPRLTDPFAEADRAFARLAADSSAPLAFARYIAPDGMTFAGTGEVNIGPATVRARMNEGPSARAAWTWWPVRTIAAGSGDLGATVGEAEIRLPGTNEPIFSKYLTVWQRQPDGSLKFVVDGGNGRPSP